MSEIEDKPEVEVEDETPQEEEQDLRGLLEDAFDEPEEAPTEEAATGAEQAAEGGDGAPSSATEPTGESSAAEASGGGDSAKPPIDWDAGLREEWGGLSEPVKKKIAEREAQVAQAMQGTAQARSIAQEFQGVVQQYGSVMAAEGAANPMDAVNGLFQTVSELRMGTPAQKAEKMAELIQRYDVDIKSLDDHLSSRLNGKPAPTSEQSQMEQMLEQRLAPVNQMMQQLAALQQQKQMATQQTAAQEVEQFAQNAEFLNDVRNDVADLIDLATKQGRNMTLEEAYNKACAMNPQISDILAKREQQQKLTGQQKAVASKRAAASSLRPGNPGGRQTDSSGSLYDALSAAWDDQLG